MTRAGFVAIIGAPNAGKSTLVNRLAGTKVSIVTRKVQTTRFPVRGVAIIGEAQVVLVDTPGVFKPRRRLDRAMVQSAWLGAREADRILHLVDIQSEAAVLKPGVKAADRLAVSDSQAITEGLKRDGARAHLALNKIDGVAHADLLKVAEQYFETGIYDRVFMISAEKGSGVDDLAQALAQEMPEGPWFYPEDQAADIPTRLLAAEITREKLYLRVHEELPYSAGVETTKIEERKDGSVRIEQTLFVEREGQRAILIGKNGATLKWIGTAARTEISEILGCKAHLFLEVVVKPDWAEARAHYQTLGLEWNV
jgi:GTPase